MPFGDYKDFDDCVAKNSDKDDPKAYCTAIKKQIEGENVKRDTQGRIIVAENVPIIFGATLEVENV